MDMYIAHTDKPLPDGITVLSPQRTSKRLRSAICIRTPDDWGDCYYCYDADSKEYTIILFDSQDNVVLRTLFKVTVEYSNDQQVKAGIKTEFFQ